MSPRVHAEARLCEKLDVGSTVFVARVTRDGRDQAMAKPCPRCQDRLSAAGVRDVYYTADNGQVPKMEL